MIVTITGKIGAGKTTVATMFEKEGCNVIYIDDIGKGVLQKEAKKDVVNYFGKKILKGKNIDPKKLANIVFKDRMKLLALHAFTHPHMKKVIKKSIKKNKINIIDAALYEEFDLHKLSKYTIVVKTRKDLKIKRLKGIHTKADIERRAKFQKVARNPDYIIFNNGSRHDLKEEIVDLVKNLKTKLKRKKK